jgi:hypothetical protein
MIYQFYAGLISKIIVNVKRKTSKTKSRESTISTTELSRFGAGVMDKALRLVNTAKKGKITIKLEQQ